MISYLIRILIGYLNLDPLEVLMHVLADVLILLLISLVVFVYVRAGGSA